MHQVVGKRIAVGVAAVSPHDHVVAIFAQANNVALSFCDPPRMRRTTVDILGHSGSASLKPDIFAELIANAQ